MDIELIREDTVGCTDKIFLNSAGSSLMPKIVVDKMIAYLKEEEENSGYEVARLRANEIDEFYPEIAKLINCDARNIAFAYNATDAYAKALSSIPFKKDDFILTTNDDYVSNQIAFLSLQKRFGIKIIRSDNLENGDIDLNNFEELIKLHQPLLVSLTHIPTNSGLVQNAEAVGKICKKYDILYLLDACQSIGQLVVDVKKIECDFLSATGRKFLRGPRGTGFLYVSDKALDMGLEPLFIDMRGADWINTNEYKIQSSAKRFELWELNCASLIGLAEAVRYANNIGLENIYEYNQTLIKKLRENCSQIAGLKLLDLGIELSNILTFRIDGFERNEIEEALRNANVVFSVSGKENAFIDFDKKGIDWAIRFSPHYFNTLEEIERVTEIVKGMRNK
ncbi:MAG: aminotransferase class V-fold PLP-dependent enzyme [Bacteroidia bacterium]